MTERSPKFDLQDRLALSIAETAQVVGLSENAFRGILPDIERIQVGRRVLISVRALKAWIEKKARCTSENDDELVADRRNKRPFPYHR